MDEYMVYHGDNYHASVKAASPDEALRILAITSPRAIKRWREGVGWVDVTTPDDPWRSMRPIRVTFEDGDTVTTCINGTRASIERYYIGNDFNLGDAYDPCKDRLVKAVKVEFLD